MNDTQKKIIVAWLNDAHALEKGLEKMLEKQIADTEGRPEVQSRLRSHLEETKKHASLVEQCLSEFDETPSGTKDIMSQLGAYANGLGLTMADDELVKGMHAAYASEQFEIATYTVLRTAGEVCSLPGLVSACDEIIKDEQSMADWLYDSLPGVVSEYLALNSI